MALQSSVDLRFLNGLLSVSSVFWPLFLVFNFSTAYFWSSIILCTCALFRTSLCVHIRSDVPAWFGVGLRLSSTQMPSEHCIQFISNSNWTTVISLGRVTIQIWSMLIAQVWFNAELCWTAFTLGCFCVECHWQYGIPVSVLSMMAAKSKRTVIQLEWVNLKFLGFLVAKFNFWLLSQIFCTSSP